MNINSKEVLVQIKVELMKRNMKHYKLAKILYISPAYLSDILNGKRNGEEAQKHIVRIMQYLEIERSGE